MKFEREIEYIVICDYSYESLFLSLKKDNPYLNIKYYTKEEVGKELEFEVDDSLISFLMEEKDLDYIKAKKLANLLIFANEDKFVYKKELLERNKISKNIYGELTFKNKEVYLFECDEDNELIKLLKRHNIEFKYLKIDEILKEKDFKNKIYLFKDYNEEFHYFYSSINRLLIEDKVDPKNIYIFMDKPLPFLIEEFSSLYKINSNFKYTRSLLSDPSCFNLINSFYQDKKIDINYDEEDLSNGDPLTLNILKRIKDFIKTYKLDEKEFDKGYLSLMEILSSFTIASISKKEGINIINRPIFKENIHLFVSNFESNVFYKVYKDDNIFLDRELIKYDLNTSSDKTLLSKRLMGNFLRYSDCKIFAKVKLHLSDKLYDSEFMNIYGLKYNEESINKEGLYTEKAKELILSTFKDKFLFSEDENYKCYNNEFKKFNFDSINNLSVTDFEKYSTCPFKFYVSKYLNIDEFESTYEIHLGNFLHSIMEEIYDDGFDFEKVFEEKLALNKEFDDYERILVEFTVKPYFKLGIENYYLANIDKFKELGEKGIVKEDKKLVDVEIDKDTNITLKAKADAKFVHGSWITIFDYKSGSKSFNEDNIKYGLDLQLPLYTHLLAEASGGNKKGFFIAHILKDYSLNKKTNRYEIIDTINEWKIEGRFDHKDAIYTSLVTPLMKDVSDNKKGNKNKKELDYDFEEIINNSVNKMKEIVLKIKDNNFDIRPIEIPNTNGKTSCSYCNYRSICYRKNITYLVEVEDNGDEI